MRLAGSLKRPPLFAGAQGAQKAVSANAGRSETARVEEVTPQALVVGVFAELRSSEQGTTPVSDQNHEEWCREHQYEEL